RRTSGEQALFGSAVRTILGGLSPHSGPYFAGFALISHRVRGTHQFIGINQQGVFHTPYAEETMSDQADGLRQLVRARSAATALDEPESPLRSPHAPCKARSLLLTSGKGGVGSSNMALNLAITLGELGQRVVLVDADVGLANIDLLCGIRPAHDLGDV